MCGRGGAPLVFDEKGNILQQNDYYPFGLEIDRNSPVQTPAARNGINRYLYNGKEFQVGSGYLDYGARMYMPELGRWGVVDPLTESTMGLSPFMYGNNNPVLMIDPDGMRTTYNWGTKRYEDTDGENVAFDQVKQEYGIGQGGGNTNCCQDSPNVKAAEAKQRSSVEGRLAEAGWKPGQSYPAIDGINTDLSIESIAIPLAKPVEWLLKPLAGLIRAQWLASVAGKGVAKGGGLIEKGLGSTGRTTAANLTEQLAMKEAMSNPAAGQIIQRMKPLTDPRWSGWRKMQFEHIGLDGSKTVIHYNGQWGNGILKVVDDFKFK